MRKFVVALAAGAGLALAGCDAATAPAEADASSGSLTDTAWTLDNEASRIAFVSIKDGEFIETHYFPDLSGGVSPDGDGRVDIALNEVETKVDIRNERMREMFFETGQFPTATIETRVAADDLADLEIGQRVRRTLDAVLSLHGQDAQIEAEAFITRISEDRVEVQSAEPVVVYLSDFDLEPGLERLREVAGLSAITASSPVTFTFVFDAGENPAAAG